MHYDQLSEKLLKDYQMFLCLRDGMIWPGGYLGPDAYTHYVQWLETWIFPIRSAGMDHGGEGGSNERIRKCGEWILLASQQ